MDRRPGSTRALGSGLEAAPATGEPDQSLSRLDRDQLFAILRDKLQELSGLYEVSQAFGSLTRLEDAYGQLVERIAGLLGAERCVVMLLDEPRGELVGQEPAYGFTEEQVGLLHVPVGEDSAGARVWRTGQPYLSNAAQTDPRNLHWFAEALGDRSLLIVPMRVNDETIGLIRASSSRPDFFAADDVRLLTIFATQAAVVVRNAMLFRQVAHERERLRAIFRNTSDGILLVDRGRTIVDLNPALERMLGWSTEEAVGRPCWEILQAQDEKGRSLCKLDCPLVRTIQAQESVPYLEAIFVGRDGRPRDVAVSYSCVTTDNDHQVLGVAIVRDISEAKQVERMKSQFLSLISHELRTPLAAIKTSAGVLLASLPADTSEPIQRLVSNIDRSSQRLESIITDLLDLARLQNGRLRLRLGAVDVREAVAEAASTVRSLVDAKGQQLQVCLPERPVPVLADRQRLEQVVLNLLSNAHKYSPSGAGIELAVEERGDEVWVRVADTGPGIPAEEYPYIFESFYRREDAETQRNVGTGLGLPIARALVDLHGGRIWVESVVGKGSTFYFTLPKASRT